MNPRPIVRDLAEEAASVPAADRIIDRRRTYVDIELTVRERHLAVGALKMGFGRVEILLDDRYQRLLSKVRRFSKIAMSTEELRTIDEAVDAEIARLSAEPPGDEVRVLLEGLRALGERLEPHLLGIYETRFGPVRPAVSSDLPVRGARFTKVREQPRSLHDPRTGQVDRDRLLGALHRDGEVARSRRVPCRDRDAA
jgi:hypothetical protein